MSPDALQDMLADLQHDLGKYMRLPVGMLPAQADQAQLRAALGEALQRTRRGPDGVTSARTLWAAFEAELAKALGDEQLRGLRAAVETALSWESELAEGAAPIDRASLWRDLCAVGDAIEQLSDQLERGG